MSLLNWLGPKNANGNRDVGLLFEEVQKRVDHLTDEETKKITGIAGLLGKVAYADMEISPREIENMRRYLTHMPKLAPQWIEPLMDIMITHRVQLFSVEDHLYARMINEVCSRDEKQALLDACFALAAADDAISSEEDATLWTIAKSLHLSHGEFITSRKRYRDNLDVLKPT